LLLSLLQQLLLQMLLMSLLLSLLLLLLLLLRRQLLPIAPVLISAMWPSCRIMPPISCTSNGRSPSTRLDASRTTCRQQ
jgi:hypothetical protein